MSKTNIRQVKLQGKYQPRQTNWNGSIEVPWLNVSGLWLEQAGFKAGDRVEITVSENTLVITNCASNGNQRA
jgi:toxic protein SymE